MNRLFGVIFLTLSIGLLPVSANQSFAAPEFDTYIVVLRPGADRLAMASNFSRTGGRIEHEYSTVFSGFAINLSTAAASALQRNPNVLFVERDAEATAFDIQNPAPSWGLDRIDQRTLPLSGSFEYSATGNGAGVRVYIVDGGVLSTHTEFSGRIVAGFSAINDGRGTEDCRGHGTHVAGIVAGTIYGVAKKATIVPVRVLDCDGSGWVSDAIAGLDWVANDHISGPAVVNMSAGGSASAALDAAILRVVNDGVTVVVAAGNETADACTRSPARVSQAVTVGATTSTDARASYSNFGTCLDLFAPGSAISSAWHTSATATNTISGTSMASPHVAGVAAVLLSRTPTLTPTEVASVLTSSATTNAVTSAGTGSPNLLLYSDPPTATKYLVTSSTSSPVAGATVTITAQLADVDNNAFATSGLTVTWTKSNVNGSFATATSITNAFGLTTVVFTTPTVAGTATTVIATTGSLTGTSDPITTTFGTATASAITTQPSGAVNGVNFTGQPVIRIVDANGNAVTNSTVNVVATIASGTGGTLSGTTTAAAIAGVATFTNLQITGTAGPFTLTFTPTSLTAVTSGSLTLSFGAATASAITTHPSGAVSGVDFTGQPIIRIVDANGNSVTNSTVNVVATIASGTGTLSGTTTVAAIAGVATFTNLQITGTAGPFTLTFTPTSLTAVTSSPFTLMFGTATASAITTHPSGAVNGVNFTVQPVIGIVDSSGNTVTDSTVNVVATIASGTGTLSGTTTVAAVAGVATFTDLRITGTAGPYTLTFTPSALATVTSVSIVEPAIVVTRQSGITTTMISLAAEYVGKLVTVEWGVRKNGRIKFGVVGSIRVNSLGNATMKTKQLIPSNAIVRARIGPKVVVSR